jgi:hypothetical protein
MENLEVQLRRYVRKGRVLVSHWQLPCRSFFLQLRLLAGSRDHSDRDGARQCNILVELVSGWAERRNNDAIPCPENPCNYDELMTTKGCHLLGSLSKLILYILLRSSFQEVSRLTDGIMNSTE